MSRKYIAILFLFICFNVFNFNFFAVAQEEVVPASVQHKYAIVPSGVTIDAILSQEINLKSVVVGQKVQAILLNDFLYNNEQIFKKESVVIGSVVAYKIAKNEEENNEILIKFTTVKDLFGDVVPINAVIKTQDLSGNITSEYNEEIVIQPKTKIEIILNQPITLMH